MTELGDLMAKKLSAQLPAGKLKERITMLFKEQTMCTIATASSDGQPRATPLECFADDMTFFIFADPGIKITNLTENPKVSISVCNQIKPRWEGDGWKGIKAAQITGMATILQPDEPESIRARKEVIRWQEYVAALGKDTSQPPHGLVLKVVPSKIEYTESELMLDGYSAKQIWKA